MTFSIANTITSWRGISAGWGMKIISGLGLLLLSNTAYSQNGSKKLNMLFITVDDLRPELHCYGARHMRTPNIDSLAHRSVLFERAYCQQADCAPSRNSIMTGLRPDALGIYDLSTFFRTKVPDVVTLPVHFKSNGYHAEPLGKIYHPGLGNQDDAQSWSVPSFLHAKARTLFPKVSRGDTTGLESDFPKVKNKQLAFYRSDAPDDQMTDGIIANTAVERIRSLKDCRFFLAVGFIKPNLPFVAPATYWDMYDPSQIKIPERNMADGMPDFALANSGELRVYHAIPPNGPLDNATLRSLIHGYRASVSMIDAQIGRLLDALEENGLMDNTIIVLWGDHGYKLGDYGQWCKHSNVEYDTNVPLIISAPGLKQGVETRSLVELVDLYPTLCGLAGLKKPSHLEGLSLVPILNDPGVEVKQVAISQYPWGKNLGYDRKLDLMGYSIRTGDIRYTRWQKYEDPSRVVAVELYDQQAGASAAVNLAAHSAYANELRRHDELLTLELGKYKLLKSLTAKN